MLMESAAMSLAPGGMIQREIIKDRQNFSDWDSAFSSRCFVHICNSLLWRQITGSDPPYPAFRAKEYVEAQIPWADYYRDDLSALPSSTVLDTVKSVVALGEQKGDKPLPDNSPVQPELLVQYGNPRRPDEVREFIEQ
jgi:hypothetical protein